MLSTPSRWKRPVELGHAARQWRGRHISNLKLGRRVQGFLLQALVGAATSRAPRIRTGSTKPKMTNTASTDLELQWPICLSGTSPAKPGGSIRSTCTFILPALWRNLCTWHDRGLGRLAHHICQRTCDPTLDGHTVSPRPASFGRRTQRILFENQDGLVTLITPTL